MISVKGITRILSEAGKNMPEQWKENPVNILNHNGERLVPVYILGFLLGYKWKKIVHEKHFSGFRY